MNCVNKTKELFPAAARGAKKLAAALSGQAAGRWVLRFFAAMVVLTLAARGTSGAALPRVSLATPNRGTIVQKASATAEITAGESGALELPAGVTVRAVYAAAGQQLKEGDAILLLDLEQLQDELASAKATRSQQEAQLARLSASTAPDGSSVTSAQQSLDRAKEDYTRTDERTAAAVDEAKAALASAQTARDEAAKTLEEAETALSGAKQAVESAETSREDSMLSAKRSVENAESSLAQANEAYSQAQASASLTAQSNAAEAEALRLEKAKNDEKIDLLTSLVEAGGLVSAPRDALLTVCTVEQGRPCPEGECLQLAKEDSEMLVQFTLPAEQAEKITAGLSVTVTQGSASAEAAVRTVETDVEKETGLVTAVLDETAAGFKAGTAQAELVFSRKAYDLCLPVSAIRQDGQGSYVLAVEETQNAFGISLTALRVPVTVKEVDSDGQYAAVEGSISGGVIVSSNRAVSPGASVRTEE